MSKRKIKKVEYAKIRRELADARVSILYHGVKVSFFEHGYFCRIPLEHVTIDADGAPNAYGPARSKKDEHGSGLDSLTAAGFPDSRHNPIDDDWRDILVQDLHDPRKPFLKKDGYYISKTSLYNNSARSDASPGKYINAAEVSYIVMPRLWLDRLGMQLGDLCLLWHTRIKTIVVAIVADICPVDEPLGEMSIAAAQALGGRNVSPRDGVEFPGSGAINCVMFMGSRPDLKWPITDDFVRSFRDQLVRRIGDLTVR
jgi:hypothetical protein